MNAWLKEYPIRKGVCVRVGGYLPPFRARVYFLGLTLVTLIIGAILSAVLIAQDAAITPYFRKFGIPVWIYYPLTLLPFLLPMPFVATPLGQWLGELFIGARFKVVITKDYIQVIRWWVYRPKYPVAPGIAFERQPHPKAAEEIIGNELRKAQNPKNPAKAMQFYEYQKSQVVLLRCGPKAIRLANIFDRKPAGLGHKADVLVLTLQRIYGAMQTGNRTADVTQTPLQYGSRPSMA